LAGSSRRRGVAFTIWLRTLVGSSFVFGVRGLTSCSIGLGTGLLEPGEVGISASNRNFKGRMGSTEAKAYLASPEVVAASAMNGKISGPGWYEQPIGVEKVVLGEGNGNPEQDRAVSVEQALDRIIAEADSLISGVEKSILGGEAVAEGDEALTEIFPGFPEKVEGEIVFCDADNLNTDGSESLPNFRDTHRC